MTFGLGKWHFGTGKWDFGTGKPHLVQENNILVQENDIWHRKTIFGTAKQHFGTGKHDMDIFKTMQQCKTIRFDLISLASNYKFIITERWNGKQKFQTGENTE